MAEDGAASAPAPLSFDKPVMVDMTMSYFCSRARFAIFLKGLEDEILLKSPADFGGLKSPTYLKLNPQGKMPILILPDGRIIPESEIIAQYILDKYAGTGTGPAPSLSTVEGRLNENLVKRWLDNYVAPHVAAFYLTMEAEARLEKLVELRKQMVIFDDYVKAAPYAVGEFSTADMAIFPVIVFVKRVGAFTCGWEDVLKDCPNLAKWWVTINEHPVAQKLRSGMEAASDDSTLEAWLGSVGALQQFRNPAYDWKLC
eukprot:TRINITY_DN518_c0_g1_i1.p1 TRINITY_DN518_c0_g1~~TRINITY_DN518_c0_g1_i1.p1  ORF type:complete len:257 (-),score=51.33 TRINITY_DN518_c0_g1_i1:1086-1856(-)